MNQKSAKILALLIFQEKKIHLIASKLNVGEVNKERMLYYLRQTGEECYSTLIYPNNMQWVY